MATDEGSADNRVAGLLDRLRDELRQAIAERLLWQAIAFVAAAAWIGLIVDRLLEPSPRTRLVVELVLVLVGVVWLVLRVAPRVLRAITDAEIVTLLTPHAERDAGLVGASLSLSPGETGPLVEATRRQASAAAARLQDVRLVRPPASMPVVWFGSLLLAGAAVLAIGRPDLASTFADRVALSPEPWPRRVQLVADGLRYDASSAEWSVVAAQGEPFDLLLSATADDRSTPPATAWVRRRGAASRRWQTLTRLGGSEEAGENRFRWRTERLDEDAVLSIAAGDARTQVRLIAKSRPTLSGLSANVRYPTYLNREPTRIEAATLGVLPEGATLTLHAAAGRPLQSVSAALDDGTEGPGAPLEAWLADDGASLKATTPALESTSRLVVSVVDRDGLASEPVALTLEVEADEPPRVRLARVGPMRAVTPDARVPLRVEVSDDHELAQVGLAVTGNESLVELPLDTPRTSPAVVETVVDLLSLRSSANESALRLSPGDRLRVTAAATDRYDLSPRPPVVSDPVGYEVVSAAELLARLGDAQRELRQSIDVVLEDARRLAYQVDLRRRRLAEGAADSGVEKRWAEERKLDARKAIDLTRTAATRGDAIRRQVVDNRLEQPALVERLALQVVSPLRIVADVDLATVAANLERYVGPESLDPASLETAAAAADGAVAKLGQIAEALEVEQSYNGLLTALRGLIREQRQVNQRTTREESERVRRDLFD